MNLFGFEITKSGPRSSAVQSAIERRHSQSASLRHPPEWLSDLVGGYATASGERVTEESALRLAAVYAAVRVLSEDVAGLPFKLYRRTDRGREEARQHALFDVLHYRANSLMTAFTFREVMMVHVLLWGNAYAEIEIDGAGRISALWPLLPWRVAPELSRKGRDLRYKYQAEQGEPRYFAKEQILHVPGLGFNGVVGKSPIQQHRETLGATKAAEKYGAKFFANDATPGFALKHPGTLSDQALNHIRTTWNQRHQGADNAHRLAILEEGMEPAQVGLPPEDAQFIETRKFGVTDVARIFRVAPYKIADLERATFSNIEHQGIEHVTSSLRPWLIRWEQAVRMRLLLPRERGEYYASHTVDAFLRGDIQSRAEAYKSFWEMGAMSPNDVREKEDQNAVPNGDEYYVPMNFVPMGTNPADEPAPDDRSAHEHRHALDVEQRADVPPRVHMAEAMQPVLLDVWRRASRREIAELEQALEKYELTGDRDGFLVWLEQFRAEHAGWMLPRILPVYQMFNRQMSQAAEDEIGEAPDEAQMEQFTRDYAESSANRHAGSTEGQIKQLVQETDEPFVAARQRVQEWAGDEGNPSRADKEARREQQRAMNAFSKAAWATMGVVAHVWRTTGAETCPLCDSLAGKRVGLSEWFVSKGNEVQGDGETLRTYSNVGHPPLHDGCDCYTAPSIGGRSAPTEAEVRSIHKQIIEAR